MDPKSRLILVLVAWVLPQLGHAQTAPEPAERDEAPEVTVVGVRSSRVAGSAHVLTEKQLERHKYQDSLRLLLLVPGVYVRGEDGFGLRPNIGLRGANSDRSKKVTLMEDGVLFGPAPYSAPAAYYFPLIRRMTQVAVVKGPSAIAYGPHSIGGAIDFHTHPIPTLPQGSLELALGQFGSREVHFRYGASNEQTGFFLEGMHLGNDGFKELDGGGDTGFLRNEWMVKVERSLPRAHLFDHRLALKFGYSDEVSDETYLGLTDADFRAKPYRRYRASALDRMRWHRTELELSHHLRFSPDLTLSTTVYRHELSRTWHKLNGFADGSLEAVLADPDSPRNRVYYAVLTGETDSSSDSELLLIGPNQRDFIAQGVQTAFRLNFTTGPVTHRLDYGFRYHYDEARRVHSQSGYFMRSGQLVRADGAPEVTADNLASAHAFAMHVLDHAQYGPLTFTPGVRTELIGNAYEEHLGAQANTTTRDLQRVVLPGLGVFYEPVPNFGLLAGAYRGFSPVPPGQSGSASPERSTNYEAGVRYAPPRTRAELIGFFNDYENLTQVCSLSSGCLVEELDRQMDAGNARIYGAEAYLAHEMRVGRGLILPLSASYTFTRAEFLNSFHSDNPQFGDVKRYDEMPYVPRHQVSITLAAETPQFGVLATGTYMDVMRERAGQGPIPENDATDGYFVLDLGAQYRVLDALVLHARLENALDAAYIVARHPFGARPGRSRWLSVGLKLHF